MPLPDKLMVERIRQENISVTTVPMQSIYRGIDLVSYKPSADFFEKVDLYLFDRTLTDDEVDSLERHQKAPEEYGGVKLNSTKISNPKAQE